MGALFRPHIGPMRFPSPEAFAEWLRVFSMPQAWHIHVRMYGKPIVRVAVPRQVPNEADL